MITTIIKGKEVGIYSFNDITRELKVSRQTLYMWLLQAKIKTFKLPGLGTVNFITDQDRQKLLAWHAKNGKETK
jgi:hypothetical protein